MMLQPINNNTNYTNPLYMKGTGKSFRNYLQCYQSMQSGNRTDLHPTDQLLLQGALRPAPPIQAAMDHHSWIGGDHNYLALHLRMEPDFLCHHWGGGGIHRGRNLTEILNRIEAQLGPHPPVDGCFIAINRPLLEDGTKISPKAVPSVAECNAEREANLHALNRVVRDGLWGGRVPVMERPLLYIAGKPLSYLPSLWGALVDSEICRQAKIFVGRLGSTFTVNIVRRRSAMGNYENFDYEFGWQRVGGVTHPQPIPEK